MQPPAEMFLHRICGSLLWVEPTTGEERDPSLAGSTWGVILQGNGILFGTGSTTCRAVPPWSGSLSWVVVPSGGAVPPWIGSLLEWVPPRVGPSQSGCSLRHHDNGSGVDTLLKLWYFLYFSVINIYALKTDDCLMVWDFYLLSNQTRSVLY